LDEDEPRISFLDVDEEEEEEAIKKNM